MELEKLPTRHLLAMLQNVREIGITDRTSNEEFFEIQEYRQKLTDILDTREHIPNKPEARRIRKEKLEDRKNKKNKRYVNHR